jgi:hypothetical protein
MKKNLIAIVMAALVAAIPASAQFVAGQSCPRYGTPQQGQGPKDGTGYGAKSGKRSGPQDGTGAKKAQQNRRGARR